MKKIQASAIYYALFLSVMFGLILGGFVLFSGFNQNFSLQMDMQERLIDNARSGVAYGQVNFQELKNNEPLWINLFGDGMDSVEITKRPWGAFTIIVSKAKHRNRSHTKIALMGADNRIEQPNLYLPDNGRPISLCGDARIEGLCFLPKKGLKRAYIEGKNYKGSKMIYGTLKESKKQLPVVNKTFYEGPFKAEGAPKIWESSVDSITVTFADQAAHFVSDNIMSIDEMVVNGQIILEARDSIFISRNAEIENAIIKSKIVYIESGFSGSIQIFASEKIVLEEEVQLLYPSVIGIVEENYLSDKPVEIKIGEKSQVIGGVFLLSEQPNFRKLPQLSIAVGATIDGVVYCVGKTELKGTIVGSLFSKKLSLKTASSAYENHLLDGQILDQLPPEFIAPNLLEETHLLKRIAWLQ